MKLLRWQLFAGLLFMPLMDGGVRLLGVRIQLFDIYFVALLFTALLAFRIQPGQRLRTSLLMLIAMSLLVLTWFLACILAVQTDVAVFGALRNVRLLIFALILALTVRGAETIRFYATGFLASVAWVSLIGWIQSLWGNSAVQIRAFTQVNAVHYFGVFGRYGERTVTAFGDPIMSGLFLAVGACAALGWALTTSNSRERLGLSALAGAALLPLLTSASRGPITAGFVSASALFLFSGIRRKAVFLLTIGAALLVVYGADILSLFSQVGLFDVSLARIGFGLESNRWEYWWNVLLMSRYYPFGVGLGNFPVVAPKYIPAYLIYINYSGWLQTNIHAESMYLTQLIEIGWLGFLAFTALVGFSVYGSWRLYVEARAKPSEAERNIRTAILGAWVAMALSLITAYGYNNFGIAMLLWFLIGVSIASPYRLRVSVVT
jgi:hypothetical protein